MTKTELDTVVRDYLTHTGGATVQDMQRDIRVESSQIKGALKRLGALGRRFGDWDKHPRDSQAFSIADNACRSEYHRHGWRTYETYPSVSKFVLWRLETWQNGGIPA